MKLTFEDYRKTATVVAALALPAPIILKEDSSWYVTVLQFLILPTIVLAITILLRTSYSLIPSKITKVYRSLKNFFWNPISTVVYFIVLISAIYLTSDRKPSVGFIGIILLLLFLLSFKVRLLDKPEKPYFASGFDDLKLDNAWNAIYGNIDIDDFGNPTPSLRLRPSENSHKKALVTLKGSEGLTDFTMTYQAYLKPGALLNVVFRHDDATYHGYMARADSRGGDSDDCFLLRQGVENWAIISRSSRSSAPKAWLNLKLEVKGSRFRFYRDEELLVEATHETYKKGTIGFLSELGEVHVDNLIIEKSKPKNK